MTTGLLIALAVLTVGFTLFAAGTVVTLRSLSRRIAVSEHVISSALGGLYSDVEALSTAHQKADVEWKAAVVALRTSVAAIKRVVDDELPTYLRQQTVRLHTAVEDVAGRVTAVESRLKPASKPARETRKPKRK